MTDSRTLRPQRGKPVTGLRCRLCTLREAVPHEGQTLSPLPASHDDSHLTRLAKNVLYDERSGHDCGWAKCMSHCSVPLRKHRRRNYTASNVNQTQCSARIHTGDPEKLGLLLDDAWRSGIPSMQLFARTLSRDLDAVKNAISSRRPDQPTEGSQTS